MTTSDNEYLDFDDDDDVNIEAPQNNYDDDDDVDVSNEEADQLTPSELIKDCVKHGNSFALFGASGLGKTERVKQADPDLIGLQLVNNMLPEEIIGKVIFPDGIKPEFDETNRPQWFKDWVKENGKRVPDWFFETEGIYDIASYWVPPPWYTQLVEKCVKEPDKNHILFIDEVTNAGPHTQSLIYHIVQEHSIAPGVGKLPPNCVVAIAGNDRKDSIAARGLPEPLFRREDQHIYLEKDVSTLDGKKNFQDWLAWASEIDDSPKNRDKVTGELINPKRKRVHPRVLNFVAANAEKLFYTEWHSDDPDRPTYALDPRLWVKVSDTIYSRKASGTPLTVSHFKGQMGYENAVNFAADCKVPLITAEKIVDNRYDPQRLPKTDDHLGITAMVLSLRYLKPEQHDPVRKFIEKYYGNVKNHEGEYLALFDSYYESTTKNDEEDLMSSMGMPMSFATDKNKGQGAAMKKAIQKGGR